MKSAKIKPSLWMLRLLQGAIIGGGAILPGVSGGVLCVSFGLYQPLMQLLAHPKRNFGRYYRIFIPVLIGGAIGFLLFARLMDWMFALSEPATVCLFGGLVAGTLPSLFREAGKEGPPDNKAVAALALSTFIVFAGMSFLGAGDPIMLRPNIGWYAFCGVLWGLSLVVPGLSSSSPLIFLGLFHPMSAGLASLDMAVVLPWALGIVATVAACARGVSFLFRRYYTIAFYTVIGFVLASTLIIIPINFVSVWEALASIACFAFGFAGALGMDKIAKADA